MTLRPILSIPYSECVRLRRLHTSSHPPFTRESLNHIKSLLHPLQSFSESFPPPHSVMWSKTPSESAILIPLMNLDQEPCILLEVRARKMRMHAGEVSFPGGKVDPSDPSFTAAALREANEELVLPPENVEILGAMEPEYSLGNRSRVWPFVGFVHSSSEHLRSASPTSPLPSYPLSFLRASPAEVSAIFPLAFSALTDPSRHAVHYFRLDPRRPYWKVRVGDLVRDCPIVSDQGQGEETQLEAWGLSGWFLNRLSWKLGWLDQPEAEMPED